jgi:3-phenylpropionate/trans-cinnamate dioxygenase ferredoxin reductase component
MSRRGRIIVAGASLGGLRATEQLRAAGWDGVIVVIGAERHMPYNRPPLSKEGLRQPSDDADAIRAADALAAATAFRLRPVAESAQWRLDQAIVAARLDAHAVELADGTELHFDGLVIATGLRSRRLPLHIAGGQGHALRTVDDAVALRRRLVPGARVVVVGGGFIGCEVAASARQLDCDVTVVEPLPTPLFAALGADLGSAVQRHHEGHGVRFELGRTVAALDQRRGGGADNVVLDDRTVLACDVLVEAIGSHPNVEWLDGNGLDLRDGLLCDAWMRVGGRPDVVAVGDVARFPGGLAGAEARRIEHWCVPSDTAKCAGPALVAGVAGAEPPPPGPMPLPWFWSDQFDLRIQGLGVFDQADERTLLEGDLDRLEDGVAVGALRAGRLAGVVAIEVAPSGIRRYRDLLTQRAAEQTIGRRAA